MISARAKKCILGMALLVALTMSGCLNERMDEDEITYMRHRTYSFGGVMFSITLVAELALYLST